MASNLGWGLQMILLALFTVALFIYRKPFANLFASVNANTFTSRMVNDALNSRVLAASANVLPPVAYMKAQKWGLDRAPQLAAGAAALPAGAAATAGAAAGADAAEAEGVATATEGDNEGATATESGGRARARGVAGYGRRQLQIRRCLKGWRRTATGLLPSTPTQHGIIRQQQSFRRNRWWRDHSAAPGRRLHRGRRHRMELSVRDRFLR